jgi:hypothetical protein
MGWKNGAVAVLGPGCMSPILLTMHGLGWIRQLTATLTKHAGVEGIKHGQK